MFYFNIIHLCTRRSSNWSLPFMISIKILHAFSISRISATFLIHLILPELTIVACIPIARQRVGKHIPATHLPATIGRPLLGNGQVNTHSWQHNIVFSVGSVQSGYKCSAGQESRSRFIGVQNSSRKEIGSSSADGSWRWLRRNGKKGIRWCQGDSTCNLKLQWDWKIRCQDTTSEDWES
jgi:hypothetical protein